VILSTVVALTGCAVRPPLGIVRTPEAVTIDVQTLGEYQTSISRIRVSDGSGKVVWEVKALGRIPQIHLINLRCGPNPTRVPVSGYNVLTPSSSDTFVLAEKKRYSVEVWDPETVLPLASRASFEFSHCGRQQNTEPIIIP
jgi:hypothetical protein